MRGAALQLAAERVAALEAAGTPLPAGRAFSMVMRR